MADISKIKPNGSSGTEYDIKDATARSALENKANNTQTFTEASTRTNIASGETMSTLFGKIKKFFTDLKTVAFTGSYNDLSNKPTIPAAQVQSDWNQTTTTAVDFIKNKPTIPTVPGVVSTSANGLAPKVTNTSNYLKGDGTWSSPANNAVTVTNRTGSSYNNNYPVVFGTNTGTGTVTEGLQKRGGDFTYNPYTEKLSVYQETVESTLKVGVANSLTGYIDFHRSSQGYRGELQITTNGLSADQNYYLPDETGTLATREYLNSNLGKSTYLGGMKSSAMNTSSYVNLSVSNMESYNLLRISDSYYPGKAFPDYFGEVVSISHLKAATSSDPVFISGIQGTTNVSYMVYWSSATQLKVKLNTSTGSDSRCLVVTGIL